MQTTFIAKNLTDAALEKVCAMTPVIAIERPCVHVYLNNVAAREAAPGEYDVHIQAKAQPVYIGDPESAARYLETCVAVGTSVETRYYALGGAWRGSRSCMNKPALWADVRAFEQTQTL